MGAGNLLGAVWNTVIFGGIWIVMGAVVDKMFSAFNRSISVLPSLQDAANGMDIMKIAWTVIMVLIFFVIWLNYLLNENSQASGNV
jgi:predicted Rossmann-fold nucleotide-binding protein